MALVAQVAVAVNGEYPPGMFDFVAGVLRWGTRVAAFILSLDDRYPPFTLHRSTTTRSTSWWSGRRRAAASTRSSP